MEIIGIDKKTFEELVSRLGQFVKRMDSINRQRNGRRMSEWMDNRIYYRPEDVERLIADCNDV